MFFAMLAFGVFFCFLNLFFRSIVISLSLLLLTIFTDSRLRMTSLERTSMS